MNVLFLSGAKSDTRKRIQRVLEYMIPKKNVRYVKSVRDLENSLRKSTSASSPTLILHVGKAQLSGLMRIKELLEETGLILILNAKDAETVALGHALRPRFMTFSDGDFLDVASVLIKMKEKMRAEAPRIEH